VEEIMLAKTAKHWLGVVAMLALGIGATASAEAASPTPISACPYTITAPGNYVVTNNLSATGNCIIVGADKVTVDLQGHMIAGNGQGYGIVCAAGFGGINCHYVVIANGTVARFSEGVFLVGDHNTVAQVTAQQNTGSGFELQGNVPGSNLVTGSLATKNGTTGILGSPAFVTALTVNDSQSNNNGLHGIHGVGVVSNSTANNNGGWGIFNSVHVTGSTAKGNTQGGIQAFNPPNYSASVVDCTASGNLGEGILSSGNVISSTASNNAGLGIFLTCPAAAYGNTAINNTSGNLATSDNTCVLFDNKTVGPNKAP
jgi:hypothetical protein